jgi:hypothetical protein
MISFALMERIGLRYVKDFELPTLPEGHHLRPYALYKLTRVEWAAKDHCFRPHLSRHSLRRWINVQLGFRNRFCVAALGLQGAAG